MMVEKAAVGRWRRREKKQEITHNDQTASMAERAATPLSIYLSDPQGRDKAIALERTQSRIKRRVYFGIVDRR